MALANCTFIRVRAFCICWMERPVSSTHRCRKRQMVRTERILSGSWELPPQQSIDIQLPDPLALLYVAFPPRQVLGSACIHHRHIKAGTNSPHFLELPGSLGWRYLHNLSDGVELDLFQVNSPPSNSSQQPKSHSASDTLAPN